MKLIKKILPFILTLAILFTGFLGLRLATKAAQLSKGKILYHEKDRRAGALFVAEGEDILLPPWNQYDEGQAVEYTYIQEQYQIPEADASEDLMISAIGQTIQQLVPQSGIIEPESVRKALTYMVENDVLYLKDFPVYGKDGKDYLLNLACRSFELLYFNCRLQDPPVPSDKQLDRAEANLSAMLDSPLSAPTPQPEIAPDGDEAYGEKPGLTKYDYFIMNHPVPNALTHLVTQVSGLMNSGDGYLPEVLTPTSLGVFWALGNESYQQLLVDSQLLLVLQNSSLVLIYDPTLEAFTGFSLQS